MRLVSPLKAVAEAIAEDTPVASGPSVPISPTMEKKGAASKVKLSLS